MDVNTAASAADLERDEVRVYANLLYYGMVAGFVLLLASFAAYLFGWLPAFVAPQELPRLWGLPVAQYLQQSHSPSGWGWLAQAGHGDFSNLVGIVVLVGCSLPPLLALVPLFLKQRDRAYAIICALEVLVLLLAASGVLGAGH